MQRRFQSEEHSLSDGTLSNGKGLLPPGGGAAAMQVGYFFGKPFDGNNLERLRLPAINQVANLAGQLGKQGTIIKMQGNQRRL